MGSAKSGVVNLHMVRGPGHKDWVYRSLALDVPGMFLIRALYFYKSS